MALRQATVLAFKSWTHPLILGVVLGSIGIAMLLWSGPTDFPLALDESHALFTDFTQHYMPMARAMPDTDRPVAGYFYPPFLALALIPLTGLGPSWAFWLWCAFQAGSIALLIGAGVAVAKFEKPSDRALLLLVTLWSVPILHNISWGQISVLVTALVFLAVACRPIGSGLALSIAVALKVYPVAFVPLFAWRRRRGSWAAVFVVGSAVLLLGVPLAAMGWGHTVSFYRGLAWVQEQTVPILVENPKSLFLPHVVARWVDLPQGTPVPAAWFWSARAAAAVLLATGCLAAHRFRREPFIALGVAMPAVALLAPTSWPHYFVYLPPLLCAIALRGWRERSDRAWSRTGPALAFLALCVTLLPFQSAMGGWPSYHQAGWLAAANLGCAAASLLVGLDRLTRS